MQTEATLRPDEPAADPRQTARTRRALGLIFFTMLMDIMGISLLLPVAPQIVLQYSPDAFMVTLVTITYAAGQFLASPILGKLGDRFGRRPVLLLSILGQAAGYLVFGLSRSLPVLYLGRLIGGVTAGNLATASAYIADVSRPEEQSKNFALVGTAWSLGLIIGPALGGLFGQISLYAPALLAAALALLNAGLGYFLLPESLPRERRDLSPWRARDFNPILTIADMSRKPALGLILLVYALFAFAFNGATSTAALFIIQKFGAVTWQVSLMLVLGGLSVALTNTFAVPPLIPRLGERLAGILSLLGLGVAYLGMFFAPLLYLVFLMNMLASFMNSFVFPVITIMSAKRVTGREMGTLMGVNSAVGSLMGIFGPLWAGLVYDGVMPGAPFWMGALVLALAAWLLSRTAASARVGEAAPAGGPGR